MLVLILVNNFQDLQVRNLKWFLSCFVYRSKVIWSFMHELWSLRELFKKKDIFEDPRAFWGFLWGYIWRAQQVWWDQDTQCLWPCILYLKFSYQITCFPWISSSYNWSFPTCFFEFIRFRSCRRLSLRASFCYIAVIFLTDEFQ